MNEKINELHLHVDGSLRPSTLKEWCPEIDINSFGFTYGMNLYQALSLFKATVEALNSPQRMYRCIKEICQDQKELGVNKTELRFAPHIHRVNAEEMLDAAISALDENTTLTLCGLYGEHPDKFNKLVEMAKDRPEVVAIDIAGGPKPTNKYSLHNYSESFQQAKKWGINRTAHLGEGRPPQEIIEAIELLDIQRIGHACSLLEDRYATQLVLNKQIVIEACLTSNYHTGIYTNIKYHPLKEWIEKGLLVSICADNSLMSRTNTLKEFLKAKSIFNLTDYEMNWLKFSSRLGIFKRD